jgi:hypothetical protein
MESEKEGREGRKAYSFPSDYLEPFHLQEIPILSGVPLSHQSLARSPEDHSSLAAWVHLFSVIGWLFRLPQTQFETLPWKVTVPEMEEELVQAFTTFFASALSLLALMILEGVAFYSHDLGGQVGHG